MTVSVPLGSGNCASKGVYQVGDNVVNLFSHIFDSNTMSFIKKHGIFIFYHYSQQKEVESLGII